ncbi:MAG: ABC transporter permease [Pseudomonadota bacterium]
MDLALLSDLLYTALRAGTPLALCALGVLLAERSGVLNLGQEGIMLMGAVVGFVVGVKTENYVAAVLAASATGAAMGLLFVGLTLKLYANPVASGLALAVFGSGLSTFIGSDYVGSSLAGIQSIAIPGLAEIPLIGKALFAQDPLLYLAWALALAVGLVLHRSRRGLLITAVGEDPDVAHRLGIRVLPTRAATACAGAALTGLGGAYLSLVYTPLWTADMTAGRGWIALAMVVLAGWRTGSVILASYLFGFFSILNLLMQDMGWSVSPNFLAMTPYVFCLLALIILSGQGRFSARRAPSALGQSFHPES